MQQLAWQPYTTVYQTGNGHHVSGQVQIAREVYSPQLDNRRDVLIYLPPAYAAGHGRFPVLYMHDGQNLFDPATSFAGEWGVDEAMQGLAASAGLQAIVVAINNNGPERLNEYSPFVDAHRGGGKGNKYINFIANTLKPSIDAQFRTRPERKATGLLGSSMGGLISLYAYFKRPEIFGFAGAMSPSFWYAEGSIFDFVSNAPFSPGRLYLDVGTREEGGSLLAPHKLMRSRGHYAAVRRMKRILVRKGYHPTRTLLHVEEKWAGHNEAAWSRRLPQALQFLLGPVAS